MYSSGRLTYGCGNTTSRFLQKGIFMMWSFHIGTKPLMRQIETSRDRICEHRFTKTNFLFASMTSLFYLIFVMKSKKVLIQRQIQLILLHLLFLTTSGIRFMALLRIAGYEKEQREKEDGRGTEMVDLGLWPIPVFTAFIIFDSYIKSQKEQNQL